MEDLIKALATSPAWYALTIMGIFLMISGAIGRFFLKTMAIEKRFRGPVLIVGIISTVFGWVILVLGRVL